MNTSTSTLETARRLIRLAAVGIAVSAAVALAACQTTKGVGRDLENLGDNIEDAAEDND